MSVQILHMYVARTEAVVILPQYTALMVVTSWKTTIPSPTNRQVQGRGFLFLPTMRKFRQSPPLSNRLPPNCRPAHIISSLSVRGNLVIVAAPLIAILASGEKLISRVRTYARPSIRCFRKPVNQSLLLFLLVKILSSKRVWDLRVPNSKMEGTNAPKKNRVRTLTPLERADLLDVAQNLRFDTEGWWSLNCGNLSNW